MAESERVEVLLVEDNPDDARMSLRALRKIAPQLTVLHVLDGELALRFFAEAALPLPQLVLLDLKLPRIHGLEVLRELRGSVRTQDVRVIVFTSSNDPSDIAEANRMGIDDFLCKPIDPDAYTALLGDAVLRFLPSAATTLN